ncbi:MAG TPA: peptidyl-prolyl cis-trans isomerase [Myxococcales bacterium]|jgi:peptidyl-prolyl cis-trans isomerase C|nr:peptidyl-prolyl cis-trans isomerase [Myxococcales bacterium]
MTLRQQWISVVVLVTAMGCRGKDTPGDVESRGRAVARVGHGAITEDTFLRKLDEQPAFVRSRYRSLQAKKEFLDNLVRFELLAQEARRQRLDQDPEVKATLEKLIVQKLVQAHAAEASKELPTEGELKKYYEGHLQEFVRPERLRVSHLFFASAANDPKRTQIQQEAKKLRAEIDKKEATLPSAFADTARTRSEDPATKSLGGDLGFKTKEELATQWGPEMADAAFGLKNQGDSAEVMTQRGIHLLKLTGRQPGTERDLAAARQVVESRVQMEKRSRATDDLVAKLRSSTEVSVDEKVLESIEIRADGTAAVSPSPAVP